jgi:hypothetical protein
MTGIEMIAKERKEQVEKHGFNDVHDDKSFNRCGELKQAAAYLIAETGTNHKDILIADYPDNWHVGFKIKFARKTHIEKLVVAGALLAAEIDRLQRRT